MSAAVNFQEILTRALRLSAQSLLGLCADLGPAPSAEEIDEARREVWGTFPREDIV